MVENIIVTTIVYILIGYIRMYDRTKRSKKENLFFFGYIALSGYLSYLFITDTIGFNLNDLLDIPFEMPAKAVMNFFTS